MRFLAPIVIALSLLSGCVVYKVDVQQGNEITADMLDALAVGMSKRDVTKVIGFPLVTDPFHADRWDYYYSYRKGNSGETTSKTVTLLFDEDTLAEIKTK